MIGIWETLKVCILGSILIGAITLTWSIQNWRYASLEQSYLVKEQKLTQKEANQQAKAATQFEQKQGDTNDTYDAINQALKAAGASGIVCFDARRLQLLNAALARKAPHSGKPLGAVPQPKALGK